LERQKVNLPFGMKTDKSQKKGLLKMVSFMVPTHLGMKMVVSKKKKNTKMVIWLVEMMITVLITIPIHLISARLEITDDIAAAMKMNWNVW
jgi:hypothetical protein